MEFRSKRLKVAIVGAGISGLGAAWLLSKRHDVTVFEAGAEFGGHANTVQFKDGDVNVPVDTGFIVCNDRNYPNFLRLMDEIKAPYVPTEMSFGVSIGDGAFEYAGADSIGPMFAQKRNILRPRFWSMIKELVRFYRATNKLDPQIVGDISLSDYLKQNGYGQTFIRDHILPMAACVWSTPSKKVGEFPLSSYLRFCQNHGLLQVNDRPQWYTIEGGSRNYVNRLIENTDAKFCKNTKISRIERISNSVFVTPEKGDMKRYDKILIATHANTALQMLVDPSQKELDILGQFSYAKNTAVLHSDKRFMPQRKAAWASWNYLQSNKDNDNSLTVTYWMNRLQPLQTTKELFVTLNPETQPQEDLVHYIKDYEHPIFDKKTLNAQKSLLEIMGTKHTYFAGAHFGYGFHEDGLQSGLFAAEQLGNMTRPWSLPEMNNRIIALQNESQSPQPFLEVAE